MEERNDAGTAELIKVLADARPERPTAVHGANPKGGRDFVAGDVHGHFPTLEHALKELSFDAQADRLFSVGDLIDRGPESERAIEWLESARITAAVRGNHEQMMCDALAFNAVFAYQKSGPGMTWLGNGGQWWYDSDAVVRERDRRGPRRPFPLAERWAAALARLPYMMMIESALGRIGVVHASGFANYAESWDTLWEDSQSLAAAEACEDRFCDGSQQRTLLWRDGEHFAESRDEPALPAALPGIDLVMTGHSPGPMPCWTRQNVLCIDTGVHYADWGHLTLAEVQGPELTLHRFARK